MSRMTRPGLHHFGWELESEKQLVEAYERYLAAGLDVHRTTDHQISHSVYVFDPEGNLNEFYADAMHDWRSIFNPTRDDLVRQPLGPARRVPQRGAHVSGEPPPARRRRRGVSRASHHPRRPGRRPILRGCAGSTRTSAGSHPRTRTPTAASSACGARARTTISCCSRPKTGWSRVFTTCRSSWTTVRTWSSAPTPCRGWDTRSSTGSTPRPSAACSSATRTVSGWSSTGPGAGSERGKRPRDAVGSAAVPRVAPPGGGPVARRMLCQRRSVQTCASE